MTTQDSSTAVVVQVILNAAFSLIGAWIGARLALKRLRKQRAFERQLEWHETTALLLFRVANDLTTVVSGVRGITFRLNEHSPEWAKAITGLQELAETVPLCTLYATKRTAAELGRILGVMMKSQGTMSPPVDKPYEEAAKATADLFAPLIPALNHAARMLAKEVRSQLGLDDLGLREPSDTFFFEGWGGAGEKVGQN